MTWQDDEDELDEIEDPDESDLGDDGDSVTVPCPDCGEPVWEQAERCPTCGRYLTRDIAADGKPWWVIVAAILALLGVLMWLSF
jgi:uncharacterized protein (DUF983 family)